MSAAIELFTRYLLPEVRGCSGLRIEDVVIRAARELCVKTEILTGSDTFVSVPGTSVYTVTMPANMELARVSMVATTSRPGGLEQTNEATANQTIGDGIPSAYYVKGNQALCLVRTPSVAETVVARFAMKPTLDVDSLDDALYQAHMETLLDGARAVILSIPGEPWSNPQAAAAARVRFMNAVEYSRIGNLAGNTGAGMRARPIKFGGR